MDIFWEGVGGTWSRIFFSFRNVNGCHLEDGLLCCQSPRDKFVKNREREKIQTVQSGSGSHSVNDVLIFGLSTKQRAGLDHLKYLLPFDVSRYAWTK